MAAKDSGTTLPVTSLVARVAAAALSSLVLVLLPRHSSGEATSTEIGICLLQFPLLQQFVSFIAREGTARVAARCSATPGGKQQKQAELRLEQQSSFNLSYFSLFACFCVSLFLVPVWLFVLCPDFGGSSPNQQHIIDAYRLAAAVFAFAGLVDAAAEVLSVRCLLLQSLGARGAAEAVSSVLRSTFLAVALPMQQNARNAALTEKLFFSPMMAFAGAQLCASLIYLQLIWLQCYRLVKVESTEPKATTSATSSSSARGPDFLKAWPPFQLLSVCSTATTKTAGKSDETSGILAAVAAGAEAPTRAALRRSFGKYISTAHMQFLPVYLMLLAQKLVLQNGEQLLLLLLLDSKAAAEYALVSGAASVICRVVFAPTESAAFDSFRVLQAQHSGGDRAAAQAAPDAGRLFPSSSIAACKKQHVSSAGKQVVKEPFCTRRKTCSPKSREGKREQHIDYRHREELTQFCCVERKELLESDSNRRTGTDRGEAGPLESMFLGRLMTLLSRLNSPSKITQSVRRPLYSPALSLLQLLLLLQGTLGLASAAAGVLFAAPALRCVFGPSTVASGSGCVLTLQVYCCYVGCLSLFGLLDAYAAATSSSTSLELLQRCYSGATAAHLILMPLSVRFAVAYGVPSGAGAAAAQVVGTIIRISCCCLSISNDMRTASKLRPMNRHFSLETSAAAQRSISQGHSGSFGRNTGKHDSSQSVSASSEAIDIEGMARRNAAGGCSNEPVASFWTIIPPGASALIFRYSCCFAAAMAAQTALRRLAVKHPPGTTATLAYDMQQVFLGKYAISLWVAEIALGLLVCVASFAVVGPLLMQYVREAYSSCHAI